MSKVNKKMSPIHPGEILKEEFLVPLGMSEYRLAKDISVPARRINEIVHRERSITADTALRLARYFDVTPEFWLGLQLKYDLEVRKDISARKIKREVSVLATV
jgi:antitoxin HigA-1